MTEVAPETRAFVLSECLRRVAASPEALNGCWLFNQVLDATGLPEEQVGPEINHAIFLLVRKGILTANTYDPTGPSIRFGGNTTIALDQTALGFIWSTDPLDADETLN